MYFKDGFGDNNILNIQLMVYLTLINLFS